MICGLIKQNIIYKIHIIILCVICHMRDMLIKLWWHQTFCADVFFRRIFATRSIFKADYSTHLVQLKTFNNDKLYSYKNMYYKFTNIYYF